MNGVRHLRVFIC